MRHRTGDGTGAVFAQTATTRDTASWLRFLDSWETFVADDQVYLITD